MPLDASDRRGRRRAARRDQRRAAAACGLSDSGARRRVASRPAAPPCTAVSTRPGTAPAAARARSPRLCWPAARGPAPRTGRRRICATSRRDARTIIDVAVWSPEGRSTGGVVTHSPGDCARRTSRVVDGIPATSVARTLLDCAPVLGRRGTERLVPEGRAARHLRPSGRPRPPGPRRGSPRPRHPSGRRHGDAAGARGAHRVGRPRTSCSWPSAPPASPEPECNPPIQLADGAFVYPDFLWRGGDAGRRGRPARHARHARASYRSDRRATVRSGARRASRRCASATRTCVDPAACAADGDRRRHAGHEFRPQTGRNS